MGGEPVAGEEDVDEPLPHQGGDVGPGAGVDHGRAAHRQELPAPGPGPADAFGNFGHQERLRFLGRHLGGHELERAPPTGPLQGPDPHALRAAHDEVAHADRVHGSGAGPGVVGGDDEAAVHLGVLDLEPPAVDLHRRRQVGGGVEPGREHAVHGGGDEFGVGLRDRVGAVGVEAGQQGRQRLLVGRRHLDAGPGQVGGGLADVHLDDAVVGLRLDDLVEDLGQDQRVDDVAGDLDDVGGAHGRARLLRPDPGDGGLVDADGGDGLEALLAVVPQVADHHLDGPGGGDGQQGADEAGQLHPDEDGQEHAQRVQVDRAAHDHGLEDVVLDLLVDDVHDDDGDAGAGRLEEGDGDGGDRPDGGADEGEQEALFTRLQAEGLTCKVVVT